MLLGQAFNAITCNRRLNVLFVVLDKQKAKNITKIRLNFEETAKFKKECKETYCLERPEQNKRPFNKDPSFSKQDGGQFATFTKNFDYQWQNGGSQGYKNRRFPGKKMQQKVNFLQQKNSSVEKNTARKKSITRKLFLYHF